MSRRILLLLAMLSTLIVLFSLGGCAEPSTAQKSPDTSNISLVWPKPPASARIRHVKNIAGAADLGISKGFFERLIDMFTGQVDSHFVRPTGVAERAGVLFIADPGAQALFIFDAERRKVLKVTRLGNDMLVSPIAVALGPADTIFLVDSRLKKVFAVDREGKLQRIVVQQGLVRPAAVAYDAARERLYVADSMAHQILVYAADGHVLKTFGSNGRQDGKFNSPTHLALMKNGNLLVTDALNYRIQIFDPEGNFRQKMGVQGDGAGNFAAPKGLATDSLQRIYVVDALFDAIQIFGDDGQLLLGFGDQGMRAGQFWMPNGLFMGAQDVLFVADAYNQRIQIFQVLSEKEGVR